MVGGERRQDREAPVQVAYHHHKQDEDTQGAMDGNQVMVAGKRRDHVNPDAKHGQDHRGHQPVKEPHRNCELLPICGRTRVHSRTSEGVMALGFFVSPARLVQDCE